MILATVLTAQDSTSCEMGISQFKKGEVARAQETLWNCLKFGSTNTDDAMYLTLTYRALKNYDSGLSKVEAALKRLPENVDYLYVASYLHYRRNEPKDSMLLLSKAYRKEPNDWRIHQLFALNYIVFRMPDAVELELNKAINLNPGNAELHYQLGRLYFSEEHFEKSIDEVRRATSIAPDYPDAFDSLGLSYEALQDLTKAGESYRTAIDLDRKLGVKDEWPLIDYGSMLIREESPEAALPLLLEALQINPVSAKGNYQAGRAMRLLKRYDEAAKYFQKTIDVDPSYSYAYYQLATLIRERGESERASTLMAKYKTLIDHETNGSTYNPSASLHTAR